MFVVYLHGTVKLRRGSRGRGKEWGEGGGGVDNWQLVEMYHISILMEWKRVL